MNPRGRPHLKQRRTVRLENLGFRLALIIIDFFAMVFEPKGVFRDPASRLSALDYGVPIRGLVSRSLLSLAAALAKKQAPYEAREIYAIRGGKSTNPF